MLLEDDGGEQRRLEAVRAAVRGRRRGSCAAWRRPAPARCCRAARSDSAGRRRRAQPRDQPPLARGERAVRRRSRRVGPRRSRSVRAEQRCLEIGEHLVGRPLVAGVDLHQLAVGVDDRRAQVVRDVARVVRSRARSPRRSGPRTDRCRRGRRSETSSARGRRSSCCACFFSTGGVSVTGSKLTLTRWTSSAPGRPCSCSCIAAKWRSISGQNVGIGHLV